MPDPDDELARLRAADPIESGSRPSSADPAARALFERITMVETTTTGPATSATRRRRIVAAVAAAAVVAVGALGIVARDGGDDADDLAGAPTTTAPSDEPITPGGPSTGSCVETYDLRTLTNREVAFDGTVVGVEGDAISFTVNRWYRGGSDAEVTLAGASTLGGMTSAGPGVALEPGTRLLVAGDGGFAWSCGFTQPYDAGVAQEWDDTLAG